jgi:hypothetical protein
MICYTTFSEEGKSFVPFIGEDLPRANINISMSTLTIFRGPAGISEFDYNAVYGYSRESTSLCLQTVIFLP